VPPLKASLFDVEQLVAVGRTIALDQHQAAPHAQAADAGNPSADVEHAERGGPAVLLAIGLDRLCDSHHAVRAQVRMFVGAANDLPLARPAELRLVVEHVGHGADRGLAEQLPNRTAAVFERQLVRRGPMRLPPPQPTADNYRGITGPSR